MKSKIITIILACCIGVLLVGCGRRSGGLKPGTAAPDFRLENLSRERFYLNQQKGKVVVAVFWATWCPYCTPHIAEMKAVRKAFSQEDAVIVGVCLDPENMGDLKRKVKETGIDYPMLLDVGGKVGAQYKVSGLPATVVIDQAQVVSMVTAGYSPAIVKQIKSKVSALIASRKGT